jgi:hypothetical protein
VGSAGGRRLLGEERAGGDNGEGCCHKKRSKHATAPGEEKLLLINITYCLFGQMITYRPSRAIRMQKILTAPLVRRI